MMLGISRKVLPFSFLIIVVLFVLFSFSLQAVTYSDDWADVWFYFSWMEEDGSWHDWVEISDENESLLYETLSLKVGQPVKCKMVAITHIKSIMSFSIYEPGTASARTFDVIEGTPHDEPIGYGVNETGWIEWLDPETQEEYTWILQTNDRWAGGRAPLNGFCQVNDQYTATENLKVDLSFANPYIKDEQWSGPDYNPSDDGDTDSDGTNGGSTPGFELFAIMLAAITAYIISTRKQCNRQ